MDKKIYLEEMNILRGLAIFLVIISHLSFLKEVKVYIFLEKLIFNFNMPLFMALSGYLFARFSKEKLQSAKEYLEFLRKKCKNFIPAYIFVSLLFFLIKSGAGKFTLLKHPVNLHSLGMMFINPLDGGFVVHLWFIYALLGIFLIYPLLEKLLGKLNAGVRTAIYFLIYLAPVTHLFCLNLVAKYIIYFHLGGLAVGLNRDSIKKINLPALIIIAFFLFLTGSWGKDFLKNKMLIEGFVSFLNGLTGIIFSYFLSLYILKSRKSSLFGIFNLLGFYSFEIYLFHTIGIESCVYILNFLMRGNGLFLLLTIFSAVSCGLLAPILFAKLLENYAPSMASFIFGRSPLRKNERSVSLEPSFIR